MSSPSAAAPRALPLPRTPVRARLRPHRDGVLIALAGLTGGLVLWWFGLSSNPASRERYGAWALLPLCVMCLAALGRRTAQPWTLAVAVVALAGDLATGSLLATMILFTDVVYAAVLYGPPRIARTLLPVSVAVTVAVTLGLLAALRTPDALLMGALCGCVTVAPAWTAVIIRDHRNAAAAERLRAEQTALLAEMDRVQAVTAERARMARELHDVVANHLSAIAIHSTAALSLGGRDRPCTDAELRTATHDALGVIRENSVQGLAEMRRLIGLLRDASGEADAASSATSPTLAGLDALLARARSGAEDAGLVFRLCDAREDHHASGPLPAPVELAAYRVVQESVTNALKHARPGTVTVALDHTKEHGQLTVRVTSPHGAGRTGGAPRAPGSGAGLIGMRERVELLGGALYAGPATGADGTGIWEVRAELPAGEGDRRE